MMEDTVTLLLEADCTNADTLAVSGNLLGVNDTGEEEVPGGQKAWQPEQQQQEGLQLLVLCHHLEVFTFTPLVWNLHEQHWKN